MFFSLVRMELQKILLSKRLLLVFLVVLYISAGIVYSQLDMQNGYNANLETAKLEYDQFLERLPQEIEKLENMPKRSQEQEYNLEANRQELEVLKQNGEPTALDFNAFDAAIRFFEDGMFFLPLLILLVAADLFSGEFASGTIKLIFSSPTERWKFFGVKLLCGTLYVIFLVLASCLVVFLAGGLALGFEGLNAPVQNGPMTGMDKGAFLLLELGTVTVGLMVVMLMGITFSVLAESAVVPVVAGIAIMAAGSLVVDQSPSIPGMRYLFPAQVSVFVRQLTGSAPLSNGIPVFPGGYGFSLKVLLIYAVVFIAGSMFVFSRRQAPA